MKMSLEPVRIAAIDLGSNALRLAISETDGRNLKLIHKARAPVRLGEAVFSKGKVSMELAQKLARALRSFSLICRRYKVTQIRCVGTSALREAANARKVVEWIYKKTGIEIELIDGVEEARLIHLAIRRVVNLEGYKVMLIDIGGGSVEVSFCENSMMSATQSFPFGTVRTLSQLEKRKWKEERLSEIMSEYLSPLENYLDSHVQNLKPEFAVGTGGNIECLAKLKKRLLKRDPTHLLYTQEIKSMYLQLAELSTKKRIEKLGLRPDRADVIMPATALLLQVLEKANIQRLLVPGVGLRDGLVWSMMG